MAYRFLLETPEALAADASVTVEAVGDALGASRPDLRIVLHSGVRLDLEQLDRGAMVAAIRRDQPWVERSIPKVGEHELDAVFLPDAAEAALVAAQAQAERGEARRDQ